MELINKSIVVERLSVAMENISPEAWRLKMLDAVANLLVGEPARYRGFGLYWWNLKKALLSSGRDEFGFEMEPDVAEKTDYGVADLNVAAAVLYESWRVDQALQSNPVHMVSENDQASEYILYDPDMEIVIKYKNYRNRTTPIGTATSGIIQESATTVRKNLKNTHAGARTINKKVKKAWKLQDSYSFQGLNIAVENKRGSTRSGVDKDGHKWSIKMKYDYGYIRSTEATDGECIDCYVNKLGRKSQKVFVVHQHKIEVVKKWKNGICHSCGNIPANCPHAYDEDKVMLGFNSKEDAVKAYRKHYDSPLFLGPVSTYSRKEFKKALEVSFGKRLPLNIKESIDAWLEFKTATTINELTDSLNRIL